MKARCMGRVMLAEESEGAKRTYNQPAELHDGPQTHGEVAMGMMHNVTG